MKNILVCIILILVCLLPSQGFSQSRFNVYENPQQYDYNSQPQKNLKESILIILDCSYSMNDKIFNRRKIDIAREVINKVLGEISGSLKIGLRVYGHKRSFLGLNDCRVSELMVPISYNSSQKISSILSTLKPTGWTPIIYSIDRAIHEDFLNIKEKKRIILVTDGMETCDGSPCQYALGLVRQNIDITIDVIAFNLESEPSALSQLRCTALSTRGKFFTADDPDEFMKSFKQSITSSKEVTGQIIRSE